MAEGTAFLDTPHVQLIVDECVVPPPLQTALNRVNARVSIRSMDKALVSGVSSTADLCVILPGRRRSPDVLDRILADASERACATLVLSDFLEDESDPRDGSEFQHLRLVRPEEEDPRGPALNPDELTGRIKALCEIRHPLSRIRDELARLRREYTDLLCGAKQFRDQIELACQIQSDLLPEPLGDTGPLSVSTLFVPADRVSGDIYDISRLDENQLSFTIADATGHGLPAALLTILIRNSLRGKQIVDGSYRIIEPDELLTKLNNELLHTNLSQCQFITALHAVYDRRNSQMRWARGGVPYPILLRAGEPPRALPSEGGLLGGFANQSFEVVAHKLRHGDTLLFYTDGLEELLAGRGNGPAKARLLESAWLKQLATDGPEAALAWVQEQATNLPATEWRKDDITAIAIKLQ